MYRSIARLSQRCPATESGLRRDPGVAIYVVPVVIALSEGPCRGSLTFGSECRSVCRVVHFSTWDPLYAKRRMSYRAENPGLVHPAPAQCVDRARPLPSSGLPAPATPAIPNANRALCGRRLAGPPLSAGQQPPGVSQRVDLARRRVSILDLEAAVGPCGQNRRQGAGMRDKLLG